MAVSGEAERPTTQDMLRVAEECDVDPRRARGILQQVRHAVENWPQFARETGVGRTTERRIGKVIAVRTIRF
ncbi:hypothetical protein BH23GEM8_BH23GEM8_21830 [soil metagenome]